jgi:hypothetical protein
MPAAPLPTTTTSNSVSSTTVPPRRVRLEQVIVSGRLGAMVEECELARRSRTCSGRVRGRQRRRGDRGLRRRGRLRRDRGGPVGRVGGRAGQVRRGRCDGVVGRGGLRRWRDQAAGPGRRAGHPGGHVRVPAPRGGRRRLRPDPVAVLPGQRGDAEVAGGPGRAVRREPLPVQDLVPHQRLLPLLLGQRAGAARRRHARAARAPDQGQGHVRRAVLRPTGRVRPRARGAGAAADRRRRAGDRGRPGDRRPVPRVDGRAPDRPPGAVPVRREAEPVLPAAGPVAAPPGRRAGTPPRP